MYITNSPVDQIKMEASKLALKRGGGEVVYHVEAMKSCIHCGKAGTEMELLEVPPYDKRFKGGSRRIIGAAVGVCPNCRTKGEEALIVDLAATVKTGKGWVDALGHSFSWK